MVNINWTEVNTLSSEGYYDFDSDFLCNDCEFPVMVGSKYRCPFKGTKPHRDRLYDKGTCLKFEKYGSKMDKCHWRKS